MKKKTKVKAKSELPEELIREEILTRLPIKSVVRFKSVCKPWLSLFTDPEFIKDHLTRNSIQNPNDYDCLMASKHGRIVTLSRYEETFVLPSDDYELVGSVQGLICLRHGKKLSLWNPAIHQSREFTLPPRHSGDLDRIGLGFHHASNDFKVVVCYFSDDSLCVSVYSANSDSWKDINVPKIVFFKTKRKRYEISAPKTFVKDCPYWTCNRDMAYCNTVLSLSVMKFDVDSDEFKLLPEFSFDASVQSGPLRKDYELVNMKDCLTLMTYERSQIRSLDVYSLDEEGCCVWSKMYSLGPFIHMDYPDLSQGFRYGGEIVYHNCGKFSCYDHRTDKVKRLVGSTAHVNLVSCFTYMPSLVYLQGMKSVHVQTQTRRSGNNFKTARRLIKSLKN
ncbi:hypothetical protein AgCh_024356 [Apium graveolens]